MMAASTCKSRPDGGPLLSYSEALSRIDQSAQEAAEFLLRREADCQGSLEICDAVHSRVPPDTIANVALLDAVGHLSAKTIYAQKSTPEHDTSAMDGFAVCSQDTIQASLTEPATFAVVDCVAAGDVEKTMSILGSSDKVCVEIMTGARFPELAHPSLDAVAKVEDVIVLEQWCSKRSAARRYIQVTRPVRSAQHRRPAGSDFLRGELILKEGTVIASKHVAALASLGISSIAVRRIKNDPAAGSLQSKPRSGLRIGILSTGSEVVAAEMIGIPREGQTIADSNGPYLVSALRDIVPHARVEHLGIAADTEDCLGSYLTQAVEDDYDVLITSGGVSKGRYDLVRQVVEKKLGGRITFHGVAVRPGTPVLFASHERTSKDGFRHKVAIFGAPGNPLAVATTLRFFIVPYLERLITRVYVSSPSVLNERKIRVIDHGNAVSRSDILEDPCCVAMRTKPKGMTVFWLASKRAGDSVDILSDQASYKLKGLLSAECWIIVPDNRSEVNRGDILTSCPL